MASAFQERSAADCIGVSLRSLSSQASAIGQLAHRRAKPEVSFGVRIQPTNPRKANDCPWRSAAAEGRQHRRSATGRAAHSLDVTNFGHADQGRYDGVLLSIVEKVQSVERLSGTSFVCRETDKEFFRIVARRFYSLTGGFIIPLIGPREERSPSVLCTPSRPINSHVAWSKAVLRLLDCIGKDQPTGYQVFSRGRECQQRKESIKKEFRARERALSRSSINPASRPIDFHVAPIRGRNNHRPGYPPHQSGPASSR
jgi:hypothetical protein